MPFTRTSPPDTATTLPDRSVRRSIYTANTYPPQNVARRPWNHGGPGSRRKNRKGSHRSRACGLCQQKRPSSILEGLSFVGAQEEQVSELLGAVTEHPIPVQDWAPVINKLKEVDAGPLSMNRPLGRPRRNCDFSASSVAVDDPVKKLRCLHAVTARRKSLEFHHAPPARNARERLFFLAGARLARRLCRTTKAKPSARTIHDAFFFFFPGPSGPRSTTNRQRATTIPNRPILPEGGRGQRSADPRKCKRKCATGADAIHNRWRPFCCYNNLGR